MIAIGLVLISLVFAMIPAMLFLQNVRLYRSAPEVSAGSQPALVSILIPARNEERVIKAAVTSALASRGVVVEVLVLDDGSADQTGRIVRDMGLQDSRVKLACGEPLPAGWCGKQHACALLAQQAKTELLLFLDADVRLAPDATSRLVRFLHSSGAQLVSGIPRQETSTILERLLIPLIHFVLLGFLPLSRMRMSRDPAYGAACGQLILVERDAYFRSGGHGAIRASRHDGLQLPRLLRKAGFATDLCDATDLAACRMYHTGAEVWRGLAKNATEGLASGQMIVPATLLLFIGQVAPFGFVVFAVWCERPVVLVIAVAAAMFAYLPRAIAARRFQQSWIGVALHPLSITIFLMIQWHAWLLERTGRAIAWKGRGSNVLDRSAAELAS